jgi:pimeloyl-ACP methyl ester carboxylesterase
MRIFLIAAAILATVIAIALITALVLAASSPPQAEAPHDIFGFASPQGSNDAILPELQRYPARDGERLAFRLYDSPSKQLLIFVHGSSYHGAGYHALASFVSASGAAKVVLPNLRGHFQSGERRGDVDYVGQLEDDIADLIGFLRGEGFDGPVALGGHSSGGGLAIRFAGGSHGGEVSRFLLLSPVVPTSPSLRGGSAGGWAQLHFKRLYGLLFLNALGIHGFDGLPIVAFNKPEKYWDGTEALSYSYRLNASYHPRYRYAADIAALGDRALILIGQNDEAIDPQALQSMFQHSAPGSQFAALPGINHFAIFSDAAALQLTADWLRGAEATDKGEPN